MKSLEKLKEESDKAKEAAESKLAAVEVAKAEALAQNAKLQEEVTKAHAAADEERGSLSHKHVRHCPWGNARERLLVHCKRPATRLPGRSPSFGHNIGDASSSYWLPRSAMHRFATALCSTHLTRCVCDVPAPVRMPPRCGNAPRHTTSVLVPKGGGAGGERNRIHATFGARAKPAGPGSGGHRKGATGCWACVWHIRICGYSVLFPPSLPLPPSPHPWCAGNSGVRVCFCATCSGGGLLFPHLCLYPWRIQARARSATVNELVEQVRKSTLQVGDLQEKVASFHYSGLESRELAVKASEERTQDQHSRANRLQEAAEEERLKLQGLFAKVWLLLLNARLCLALRSTAHARRFFLVPAHVLSVGSHYSVFSDHATRRPCGVIRGCVSGRMSF